MKTAMSENKSMFVVGEFEEQQGKGIFISGAVLAVALVVLVGVWGLACLIGAVVQYGPLDVIQGWISAVTGI